MKIFKRVLLLISVTVVTMIIINYPRLNIISGYSAKNTCSSVFLANRSLAFTDATDNNFSPINIASDQIDLEEQSATASTLGLLTRKAIYREGLGSVLITKDFDPLKTVLVPKRMTPNDTVAYPYGNAPQVDTVFNNVDYEMLDQKISSIFNDVNKTRAVVAIYKNQIIAEKYAEGFDKDSKILGWSMTKSVLSTVYGIMQHLGKINVKNKAPVVAWQNDDRKEITIHNLLQMNSGLEWDENYEEISDVTKMLFLEEDMTKTQLQKPLVALPNSAWNYSSGTSNLLSGILREQLGSQQAYLDFWYRELIDKIGMSSMTIETDLTGHYVGSSYAWATPRDWGKLGLLYLHRGNWNGLQLFNPKWTDYITEPTPNSNGSYGAHFWLNANGKFKDLPRNMFYADGYQGQFVFVIPDKQLVLVRMGLDKFDINDFLKDIIESIHD